MIQLPKQEKKEEKKSCDSYLNMQVNNELKNSLFYSVCQDWCARNGFNKASNFFAEHSLEEKQHSDKILVFMQSRDYVFKGYKLEMECCEFKSLIEVIEKALEKERKTTNDLYEILCYSIADKSPIVEGFIRDMLREQEEEEETFRNLRDIAKDLKSDSKLDMLHLDEYFV